MAMAKLGPSPGVSERSYNRHFPYELPPGHKDPKEREKRLGIFLIHRPPVFVRLGASEGSF